MNETVPATLFELQCNMLGIIESKDKVATTELHALFLTAHTLVNPWRIIRVSDGVMMACSYDGFTSIEQAAANGRVE